MRSYRLVEQRLLGVAQVVEFGLFELMLLGRRSLSREAVSILARAK
jgi:hypothetical protein